MVVQRIIYQPMGSELLLTRSWNFGFHKIHRLSNFTGNSLLHGIGCSLHFIGLWKHWNTRRSTANTSISVFRAFNLTFECQWNLTLHDLFCTKQLIVLLPTKTYSFYVSHKNSNKTLVNRIKSGDLQREIIVSVDIKKFPCALSALQVSRCSEKEGDSVSHQWNPTFTLSPGHWTITNTLSSEIEKNFT